MFGFKIARIDGRSMEPMLTDGSFALFRRAKAVEQGDVILVDHEEFGLIVKQAAKVSPEGKIALIGISPESTSSQRLGCVEFDRVIGKMVARIPITSWRR